MDVRGKPVYPTRRNRMARSRSSSVTYLLAIAGVLLVAGSWWHATQPSRDLTIRTERAGDDRRVPVTHVSPAAVSSDQGIPGVLVAHGFGSSRRIMLGYAYRLAYAGYGVTLWDFQGHGGHPRPLGDTPGGLQEDVEAALGSLLARPEIDSGRIAIVGHSMGSGAAMEAGIRAPETYAAVVAVSPTGAGVTADTPRNLLLQAGSLELRFVANAERLLAEAGGAAMSADAFASGTARNREIVDGVEHITILFSEQSHSSVVEWLDRTFAIDRSGAGRSLDGSSRYTDRRWVTYAAHFAGWMMIGIALGPLVRSKLPRSGGRGRGGIPAIRARWWVAGMLGGPFVATGVVAAASAALSAAGVAFASVGGMLIAGAAAGWFLVHGSVWLAVGFRPSRPHARSVVAGVGIFAALWIAVGLMGQQLAFHWLLSPPRIVRWPVVALASLPWLLAAGYVQSGSPIAQRVGVFLVQTLAILAGLAVAGLNVAGLSALTLILPALPLAFAAMAIGGGIVNDPWAYAIGNALFFGWLLVAVFPLV